MIFSPKTHSAILLACCTLLAACGGGPDTPDTRGDVAALLADGDGFSAELRLRQKLEDGAGEAEIAADMGEAEMLQGELGEARRWLAPGAFTPDTAARGFLQLGRLEMREGNLAAAGQAFDRSAAIDDENPELWVDIGRLRYRGGEQAQAVEASERAVELGPNHAAALQFHGQLVRDSDGMDAALPWFERALKSNPDDAELLGEYAATLGETGRAKEMLAAIRRMTEIAPGHPRAYYLQAVLAARANQFDLARSLLSRSGNLDRNVPAAMLLSGLIDLENGNYSSAAQMFDRLYRLQPDNGRVRDLLARALSLSGADGELIYRMGEAASRPGSSPYLLELIGRAQERVGNRKAAADVLARAAQPRSANLAALRGNTPLNVAQTRGAASGRDALALVRALIVDGQFDAAASSGAAIRRRFPGSADALGLAADASLADTQILEAIEFYRRSADIRRPWPLTRRMIAAYRALYRQDDAVSLLERHLAGDPGNHEAAAMLGVVMAERGDWIRAVAALDHAIAHGASRDPEMLALRAQAALRLRRLEEARAFAVKAYAVQPMNRFATLTLGLTLGKEEGRDVFLEKAGAISTR
ncbi:hypothetical protein HME9302_01009 [Alteripontixanthobacter maritimus]|uniref:Uncharacterized protein n=1 Tax=Alteripontixanthobacter maritimus TaxID=2161824 RepID=A0A369Q508_9SPHN|nr:tetratricopeptide repeat protein [Alteripontixanthobacter maritimus]RDC59814.1 hypothetical protein HME9302_01009 [Alteripontixanthobacter maritimus]